MLSCPWSGMAPATLRFCEEPLCAWVVEPGNTWTNIGLIFVGLLILRQVRSRGEKHLKNLAYFAILTGLFSAFFHGSKTLLGQVLDFSAMYLESGILISATWARLRGLKLSEVRNLFLGLWLGSTALIGSVRHLEIPLFAIHLAIYFGLEWQCFKKRGSKTNYTPFLMLVVIFALGYGAWIVDYFKILCSPQNHWISGHAIWHLFGAASYYWIYLFLRQFLELGEGLGVASARVVQK